MGEETMYARRAWLAAAALAALAIPAAAADTLGVTASEIKIGQTMPHSGPASAYGTIGKAETAYFNMINEQGGINSRKLNLISLDDSYSPPKTVEQIRRLVEQEDVAFIFQSLGTPSNTAIQKYLNVKKVPQLFDIEIFLDGRVRGRAEALEDEGDILLLDQAADLLHRLGRAVAVVQADQIELAAVDAALLVDHVEIGGLGFADGAVSRGRAAMGHGLADLDLAGGDA